MRIDPDAVKATELLKRDLVRLEMNTPIDRAIEIFEDYGVSGAPVVDAKGRLCGVVSASDILQYARTTREEEGDKDTASETKREVVGDWMTPDVFTVGPDATLGDVCALMERETIHRVFVTVNDQLLGVISSFDVVSFVAKKSSAWSGDCADVTWGHDKPHD